MGLPGVQGSVWKGLHINAGGHPHVVINLDGNTFCAVKPAQDKSCTLLTIQTSLTHNAHVDIMPCAQSVDHREQLCVSSKHAVQ